LYYINISSLNKAERKKNYYIYKIYKQQHTKYNKKKKVFNSFALPSQFKRETGESYYKKRFDWTEQ